MLSPNLEIGPYFVDGQMKRSNILANIDGSTVQSGVPLVVTVNLLNAKTCAAIADAQIDIWQANADGVYSDESVESTLGQTSLRGYQVTDSNGSVAFTTIFPGWYSGRTPHIHLMIRTFSGSAVAYEWTTQLLFEQTDIDTTLQTQAPYDLRATAEPDTSNTADHVYSAMVTDEGTGHASTVLTLTGSAATGYAATINLAVDLTDGGGTGGTGGPGGAPPGSTGTTPTTTTTTTKKTVAASLTSCHVARTATNHRRATIKVKATEAVSVFAQISRNCRVLGQSRLAKRASGARTLYVPVKDGASAGKATLHLTFTNAAGTKKTVTRTIRLPARAT